MIAGVKSAVDAEMVGNLRQAVQRVKDALNSMQLGLLSRESLAASLHTSVIDVATNVILPITSAGQWKGPLPKSAASLLPSAFWSASRVRASGRPQRIECLASSSASHLDSSCTQPRSQNCCWTTVG